MGLKVYKCVKAFTVEFLTIVEEALSRFNGIARVECSTLTATKCTMLEFNLAPDYHGSHWFPAISESLESLAERSRHIINFFNTVSPTDAEEFMGECNHAMARGLHLMRLLLEKTKTRDDCLKEFNEHVQRIRQAE